MLGSLINKTFQIQAASFNGNAIQLSEAERKYPRPPQGFRTEPRGEAALVDQDVADTAALHGLCSELSPGGHWTHEGVSSPTLSDVFSFEKEFEKTPKNSEVHSD